ncbi:MAG: hypothetical protein ACI4ME_04390 [Aristaeellaceae bacterium]
MLTSLFRAICDHLTPLGVPVYLADCVPDGAAFPYITANIAAPLAAHTAGAVTLTLWCAGDQANAQRLSQVDELLALLPARGIPLTTAAGVITLRQTGGARCLRESGALGIKTVWKLCCFPAQ